MSTTSPPPRPARSARLVSGSSAVSSSSSSAASSAAPRPPPISPIVAKGATARSAVSPRVTGGALRRGTSLRVPSASTSAAETTGDERPMTRDALTASLKKETQEKEDLLVRIQTHEQTITTLTTENGNLTSTLNAADIRLNDLYAEQSRMESELAAHMEVTEKLRTQLRDAEKEKRDALRRYTEQAQTFEAERQAFYDNEQHLKSRIQRLTQARGASQPTSPVKPSAEDEEDLEPETKAEVAPRQSIDDDSSEPAEMTALRLELSTLAVSHTSLQSTMQHLQGELLDLKRVNNELQEENESYNILLRERTLNGQFDLNRHIAPTSDASDDDSRVEFPREPRPRSALNSVSEVEELKSPLSASRDESPPASTPTSIRSRKNSRRTKPSSLRTSSPIRGESLADLPVAGPGLDLAAEMGRAENKDMRTPTFENNPDSAALATKKEPENARIKTLEAEIKSLKEANKALTLYSSKIIDRIISQEGFEHVLAIDFDKSSGPKPPAKSQSLPQPTTQPRPLSQSFLSFRTQPTSAAPPATSVVNTSIATTTAVSAAPAPPVGSPPASSVSEPLTKRARRGLSMDWTKSLWGGGSNSTTSTVAGPDPKKLEGLRPLNLDPNHSVIKGAKKLETEEDDEDKIERARLAATMKLMGIEQPAGASAPVPPILGHLYSAPPRSLSGTSSPALSDVSPSPAPPTTSLPLTARIPFFGRKNSEPAVPPAATTTLTKEALGQATAESSIAAFEARERALSAEIARGKSGGFTELGQGSPGSQRSSLSEKRRKRRGSGGGSSVSTLFSAGRMSRTGSHDLNEEDEHEEGGKTAVVESSEEQKKFTEAEVGDGSNAS